VVSDACVMDPVETIQSPMGPDHTVSAYRCASAWASSRNASASNPRPGGGGTADSSRSTGKTAPPTDLRRRSVYSLADVALRNNGIYTSATQTLRPKLAEIGNLLTVESKYRGKYTDTRVKACGPPTKLWQLIEERGLCSSNPTERRDVRRICDNPLTLGSGLPRLEEGKSRHFVWRQEDNGPVAPEI